MKGMGCMSGLKIKAWSKNNSTEASKLRRKKLHIVVCCATFRNIGLDWASQTALTVEVVRVGQALHKLQLNLKPLLVKGRRS